MQKYFLIFWGLLFFSLSGFVSNFESRDYYLTGTVQCMGESCQKVIVYYDLEGEVIADQTKGDGTFLLPYTGKRGDEVTVFFEKNIGKEINCTANPLIYKIRSLGFFEKWITRPKLYISKFPILMDCEKGEPKQVKH